MTAIICLACKCKKKTLKIQQKNVKIKKIKKKNLEMLKKYNEKEV